MTTDNLASDFEAFTRIIEEETERLLSLIPEAESRQWTTSPVPRPRDEEERRTVGASPSDPTADVATDPRRMAVRASLLRSRDVLREAAVALRGVRLGMERNIKWYDGE